MLQSHKLGLEALWPLPLYVLSCGYGQVNGPPLSIKMILNLASHYIIFFFNCD